MQHSPVHVFSHRSTLRSIVCLRDKSVGDLFGMGGDLIALIQLFIGDLWEEREAVRNY